MNQMAIVSLLLGIVLLLLGRRLFWLFVGVAGFLVGIEIAERFVAGPEGMKLLIAIAAGMMGRAQFIFIIPKLLRSIFKCHPKELCWRWLIRSHWAEG